MRSIAASLLMAGSVAHAVPAQFTHQGRLLDADGAPLDGEVTLIFRVTTGPSGGDTVWEDTLSVSLDQGFYAAVLGADEDGNPLDTEALSHAPVWLEIQLEGEAPMFPRSPIHSVPFATMAQVAEELVGGPVDASQIAVAGTPVINEAGEWVGPATAVNWSDLEGIPSDFADGVDDNTDTLMDLAASCSGGDIPVFDEIMGAWLCNADAVLTEDEVDAMVADNGYAMASDLFAGGFSDLTGIPDGLDDGDDNTQLTEEQVDAYVSDNGYAMASSLFSGGFSDLTGTPEGLDDGDDNTQLTEEQVDAYVSDNGYAMAADAFGGSFTDLTGIPDGLDDGDDDTTRSDDDITTVVTTNPIDLHAGTTIGGAGIATSGGGTIPTGLIAMWSGSTPPDGWLLCDGTHDTPDLRNRFIVAAGDDYDAGDSGPASIDLDVGTRDAHPWYGSGGWRFVNSVSASNVTPPYYALAYIMKE